MTIGASPSMSAINTEMGVASTLPINMDDAFVRFFGQAPSTPGSAYSMGTFIGKSSENFALFVGQSGGQYGYVRATFGNISGGGLFRGNSVRTIELITGAQTDMYIELDGLHPIGFFNGIQFRSTDLSGPLIGTRHTALSATYSQIAGTFTRWLFSNVSDSWAPYVGQNIFFNWVY